MIVNTEDLNMSEFYYKIVKNNFGKKFIMSSNSNTNSKAPKLPRITASLDEFDAKIVENLVGYKGQNKSEVIRVIIKEWTAQNTEVIQNEYGISLKDIRKEIELKKDNKEMKDLIDNLPTEFKRITNIEIDLLADKMGISSKTLLNLIGNYGDYLEDQGLNLEIEGSIIKKV